MGATRGNGIIGEDVTVNLRTVRDVPLRLHESAPQGPDRDSRRDLLPVRPIRGDERSARARRRSCVRKSAQRRRRKSAECSIRRSPLPARCDSSATRSRRPTATSFRSRRRSELLDALVEWGVPVAPHRQRARTLAEVEKWAHDLEHKMRGRAQFRDRRRRGESRFAAAPGGAGRRRRPRAALGDRAEVRARHRRDETARHRGQRRTHGSDQSVRGAGAGGNRRRDREAGDAPQRRPHHRQGSARWATGCR